jgi:hypothetical protein
VTRGHPRWGPKKLRAVLSDREPRRAWPAASTMGDLLRRAGLSQTAEAPAVRRRADATAGGRAGTERCLDGGF